MGQDTPLPGQDTHWGFCSQQQVAATAMLQLPCLTSIYTKMLAQCLYFLAMCAEKTQKGICCVRCGVAPLPGTGGLSRGAEGSWPREQDGHTGTAWGSGCATSEMGDSCAASTGKRALFPGAALVPQCSPRCCCRAGHRCLALPEPGSAHADKARLGHSGCLGPNAHRGHLPEPRVDQHVQLSPAQKWIWQMWDVPLQKQESSRNLPCTWSAEGHLGKGLLNTRPTGVINAQNRLPPRLSEMLCKAWKLIFKVFCVQCPWKSNQGTSI